jgi:hypothetical protein
MSTYPGENPQPSDDQPADDGVQDTTEPTQPVGYWERQAAERAAQEGRSPDPSPTTPYEQGGYPQAGPPPANPYQPQQSWYGQQGQPAPYAYPPGQGQPPYGAFSPPPPAHPQSTLAMVLGLVGLIGSLFACGLTLVVSPFAWAIGHNALKEIRASHGRLGGESQARTGMITGIIGTVLLVLAVLAIVGFIVLIVLADTTGTGSNV